MKHQAMNPYLPLWEYVPDGTEPGTKMFDPGVLVDEDGRVFLYIGFCPTPDFPWAQLPASPCVCGPAPPGT